MLKKFLKSIGVLPIKKGEDSCSYKHTDYDLKEQSDSEKIVLHKEFLKSLLE